MADRKKPENEVQNLFQHLLAIELWRAGLSQQTIAKRLRLSKTTINSMLKGVDRQLRIREEAE